MRTVRILTVAVTVAILIGYGVSSDSIINEQNSLTFSRNLLDNLDNFSLESRPYPVLFRASRQTKPCLKSQWKCKNGQCIGKTEQCDGEQNCADGSDEAFPKCRGKKCPSHLFQCTYGACVDGDAECNGIQNCIDNSDENNKKCIPPPARKKCSSKKFECGDGQCISMHQLCDGILDCSDKSDETLYQCSKHPCASHLFRCAYGACTDGDAACNNIKNCEDASDEMPDLCKNATGYDINAYQSFVQTLTTTTEPTQVGVDACIVPPKPENGNYKALGKPAYPGQRLAFWSFLNYECEKNFVATEASSSCDDQGVWFPEKIECIRACPNLKSASVDFRCSYMDDVIPCDSIMKPNTIVTTTCKTGHIETNLNRLKKLKCIKGNWDNPTPKCIAECGEESSIGTGLSIGGQLEKDRGSPWHVAIYSKSNEKFIYICGGSIVSAKVVISAAHCFHNDQIGTILPESGYAVAAGKRLSAWDSNEQSAQRSNIFKIITSPLYGGFEQNLQHDIAILIIETPFKFGDTIHPVCLDLQDGSFKNRQTTPGSVGKVVGWGLTEEGNINSASPVLLVVNLPVIDYNTCKNNMLQTFRRYLTEDKLCAGYLNGTAVCKGDSGGGLVFPANERDAIRYYLRAIVSVSDLDETKTTCKKDAYTGFTNIWNHRDLINEVMDEYN